jgi:mono/diheme cytochrome c family protein
MQNQSTISVMASALACALLLGACSGESESSAETDPEAALAARGRSVYMAYCIACHNPDPTKPGGLGPPNAGASRELLEAKVLRGEYPPDYLPLRDTNAMMPLPHLERDIEALTVFLARSGR